MKKTKRRKNCEKISSKEKEKERKKIRNEIFSLMRFDQNKKYAMVRGNEKI